MPDAALPALLSVLGVSALSLAGAATLGLGPARLRRLLPFLVALAAGALLGDSLLHLLPEATAHAGAFTPEVGWAVLGGLLAFFAVESLIHWHHHGEDVHAHEEGHVSSLAWMNLLGDSIHNLIDGILIAGTWMASPGAGLATTLAVALHEIPQEFGDFGVLVHAGMPVRRALLFNALSGAVAILGALLVLLTGGLVQSPAVIVPVAAGGFLYIACADLVPELRRRARGWRLVATAAAIAFGILLVALLPRLAGLEDSHGHAHGEHHDHAVEGHE